MKPVGFDLETAPADQLWTYGDGFMKLAGYTDPTTGNIPLFTEHPKALIQDLERAPWIYGHNIFEFDLLALAHIYGADWEALTAKAVDTIILERLANPPMARDTGGSVDKYDLDHVCERYGIPGKTGKLSEIAKKHGGFENIPVEDTDYRDYLAGDVEAIRGLIGKIPNSPLVKAEGMAYARREHLVQSLNGRMTLNGFRVDIPLLEKRISEGEARKREALEILRDDFDLPLGRFGWKGRGKDKQEFWEDFANPLATLEGRQWLIEVYQAFGVRNPPLTDKGQLAMSAEALKPLAESAVHPDLVRILDLMRTVTTIRTVYQTVQDHLAGDRVHPMIKMIQASGRSSVTSPGLTVFGKHGGRHHERDIFLPEEGHVLLSADLSQVDMRAVAGHCQDPNYMALFEPGKDAHLETAILFFGDPSRRQEIKPITHGANYGLGRNRMVAQGFNPETVRTYFEKRQTEFPGLVSWQDEMREIGRSGELLDNGFGRKMRCDPARAYTQAPALMGQGAAADILKEAQLRMPAEFRPYYRLVVHDELVFSVPREDFDEIAREVEKAMTFEWKGVPILCDVSKPGNNWGEVSAK